MSSQNLKDKCDSNTKAAIELRVENSKMLLQHEDELLQQEFRHKETITSLRKRHFVQTESLKETLNDTTEQLTDMSMDVANEYIQLKNSMNAKLRHITKQSEHSEAISKARLGKLKISKENETKLRETLETTTDTFEQHLSTAHAEIERLTDRLADSNAVVEELQESLVQAREELGVSVLHHINFMHKRSHYFCYFRN